MIALRICILANVAFIVGFVSAQVQTCTFTSNGHTWDMSGLIKSGNEQPWSVTDGPYTYMFNVCGRLTGSACTASGGSAYQAITGPPLSQCIMTGNYGQNTWKLLDIGNPGAGIVLTYGGGDACGGRPRETVIQFKCDKNAIPGYPLSAREQLPPGCSYLIEFQTAYACLDAPPPPSKDGGIGGGWIFFIIYTVGFTVYCIVGIIIKIQRYNARGSDIIPNKGFWSELPSLVKDGVKFAIEKLKSCCGRGSYQAM